MTDYRIITRAEGGIVPLRHTSAKVRKSAQWLLVHHVGAGNALPRPGWSDAQHMASLQAFSSSVGKTWEYNYVVTFPNAYIWEMAGEFQAAHCANANGWSIGVQINITSGNQPTKVVIDAVRWLADSLVKAGRLTPDYFMVPHYRMRNTGCSSPELAEPPGARWNSPTGEGFLGSLRPEFLVPWSHVEEEEEMLQWVQTTENGDIWLCNGIWRHQKTVQQFALANGLQAMGGKPPHVLVQWPINNISFWGAVSKDQ